MNRGWTGKKRNGYLCMPVLILMLTAVICAHTAACAGDTEAESVVVLKETVQETEGTAGQRQRTVSVYAAALSFITGVGVIYASCT